jgi:hypothetical protein
MPARDVGLLRVVLQLVSHVLRQAGVAGKRLPGTSAIARDEMGDFRVRLGEALNDESQTRMDRGARWIRSARKEEAMRVRTEVVQDGDSLVRQRY